MFKYFTASGLVFNDKNEILLIKHRRFGVWLPPGGQLDVGEAPHEAVVREVLEETGIEVEIISKGQGINAQFCREIPNPFAVLGLDVAGDGSYELHDTRYLCRAVGGQLSAQIAEVSDVGWFSYEEFKKLETFDDTIQIMAKAMEYMKNVDEAK